MFESQRETITSNRDGELYTLQFAMSHLYQKHTRDYRKLFYFIAQIGGFVKAFLIIGWVYQPFLKRKYYIDLINRLYSVDQGDALKNEVVKESAVSNFIHEIADPKYAESEENLII